VLLTVSNHTQPAEASLDGFALFRRTRDLPYFPARSVGAIRGLRPLSSLTCAIQQVLGTKPDHSLTQSCIWAYVGFMAGPHDSQNQRHTAQEDCQSQRPTTYSMNVFMEPLKRRELYTEAEHFKLFRKARSRGFCVRLFRWRGKARAAEDKQGSGCPARDF
jgi:hypothetical protein